MNKKIGLVSLGLVGLILTLTLSVALAAPEPDFGGVTQFRDKWVAQDKLVGDPGINRPYTWGPNVPDAPVGLDEPYSDSPGGTRLVLYLDKARMEINNPTTGFVTTGLAVKELVSGKRQDGDNTFTQLTPSQTQVAGDPVAVNPDGPVYASFKDIVTLGNADANSKPNAVGSAINAFINKAGVISTITPPVVLTIGAYNSQTGHNIARPFVEFETQQGPVTDPVSGSTVPNQLIYTADPTSNVFGLPISEPYWVTTKVAGTTQTVLVQLFERRVLTYNPALATNRVEMGNLGQHYYQWRYVESGTSTTTPPATVANFAGTWNTNFALVNLNQTGNAVIGNFQVYSLATSMALHGTVTANTLTGYWGSNTSNTFTFTLASGGTSFGGNFLGTNQWCGVKSGSGPLPAGCGFSGLWNSNFAQVELAQNGPTIAGAYRNYDQTVATPINGTVNGDNGLPIFTGNVSGVPFSLRINKPDGTGFDGHWGTNNQWCGVRNSSGPLPDGCGWSGKWNLSGAGTVANLSQNGANVTGTFIYGDTGTITGNLTTSAWSLKGSWAINTLTGTFKWNMLNYGAPPQKFSGNYNDTHAWCGYRDGTSAPVPCLGS